MCYQTPSIHQGQCRMITSVVVVVISEHTTHCLLLLILNLKYNLFFLVTGIKWCGSLHLFGSSDHLSECDWILWFSHRSISLGFLALFHFLLGLFSLIMPMLSHTMPESDWEVQERIKEVFGFTPCLWQIHVIHAILAGDDVITIAKTGSGKSMTYWMPVLFIKYGISTIVTPLKLLGSQFAQMLEDNGISTISITAANATNELFDVNLSIRISYFMRLTFNHRILHVDNIKSSLWAQRFSIQPLWGSLGNKSLRQ